MASTFPRLRAAAVDQRAHNVYYRQTQLEQLCKALIARIPEIKEAIASDYGHSPAEVAIEINLALAAVKRDYASLQPIRAKEEEYLVAAGKDAPLSRRPVGIVYIEPCMHTRFYSVVVPLSAAIAAGNCVIVLLENNLRALSNILRQTLSSALDRDTFAIASSPIEDQSLLESASTIHVLQNSGQDRPKAQQVASSHASRTVAIVDRTADVQLAARELVAARFSFRGRSPYAPDCVLVNEFVKQAFLQAVLSECVNLDGGVNTTEAKEKSVAKDAVRQQVDSLKQAVSGLRIVRQDEGLAVVDVPVRMPDLIRRKIDAPVLIVHAVRSLDDAIDLINSTTNNQSLAAYHFANAVTGKYLAQYIDADITFVNNIPRDILVGPAFPTAHPVTPGTRYPTELFTVQRPAYSTPWLSSAAVDAALRSPAVAQRLIAEATSPLAIMSRSKGGGVGFFEQGFLMNAGLILTTTISVLGGGIYLARRSAPLW